MSRAAQIPTLLAPTILAVLAAIAGPQVARAADAPMVPAPAVTAPPPPATAFVGTVLNVIDPDRAVAFYRDVLGLTLAMTLDHGPRREYMLRFPGPGAQTGLILQHDSTPTAARTLERGTAFNRLVLRVGDLDGVVARLDARHLPHPAPRGVTPGYRILQLTDPEGTALEIIQAAPAPAAPASSSSLPGAHQP